MCGPVAYGIASLIISAAGAVAQDQSARSNARAQKAYQEAQMRAHNEAAEQNAQAAIKEQNEQTTAENMQQMQNQEAAAREKQANQRDYLEKKGAATASSPYAAGASFDSLMADYSRAYAMNNDIVQEQLEMHGIAARTNIEGYKNRAATRIDSQQAYIPAPIAQANTWATALGFAGDAMGTYNKATNYGRTPLWSKSSKNVK